MLTRAPKGTKDILPQESYKWHYIEDTIGEITKLFGYQEIRTPVFEHTELFERGVGDTTDIVQKEMYTFLDKGNRSITLKPEGTAGVVRAYIEHKLYADPQPVKMYYVSSFYRYERPQAGRLREFHQFGVEVFGAQDASIDVEIITLAMTLFKRLGITGLNVNINSIGCPKCRSKYNEALRDYLKEHYDELCDTCKDRYEKNPLRILDCKEEGCKKIIQGAPHMLDYLCDECESHFDDVKRYLSKTGFEYQIDPTIVRGLDYYTKTVFEIKSKGIGAQSTVCGGGRYDGLVEKCGGSSTPGIGFGLGLERLIMVLENQEIDIPKTNSCDVFLVSIGDRAKDKGFEIVKTLRENGIISDMDHTGRSVKAQFKYANKIGAKWVLTLGDNELDTNSISVKNMDTGEEKGIGFDSIVDFFNK